MMKPLLSIIIPTKNRYNYLSECIKSLYNLNEKNSDVEIEIIIQDNTPDNKEILPLINSYRNSIHYFHISESLSVVENCDRAVLNSTGKYICFIGDDDSVTKDIITVVKWMEQNSIESCIGTIPRYNWPDMVYKYHKFKPLQIPKLKRENYLIDVKGQLELVLKRGANWLYELPKLYHGIVSRDSLNQIYERAGSYFPGPSPDMANAVALATIIKRHAVIDVPFIVSGFSYKSGGGQGTRHAHEGEIKDLPHLPKNTAEVWEKRIPKYWTSETIYAESAIKALKNMGRDEYLKSFNYCAFYATFIVHNWRLRSKVIPYLKQVDKKSFICQCIRILSRRGRNYIVNTLESKMNLHIANCYTNSTVHTLIDAVVAVEMYVQKYSIKLPELVNNETGTI